MSVSPSPTLAPSLRVLPTVLYFDGDVLAQRLLVAVHRFRRLPMEQLEHDLGRGEWVLVCSSEERLQQNYERIRLPNVRVIGVADARFRDPRVDGVVHMYLPPNTSAELVERAVENALDHITLIANRFEINEQLTIATQEINELNKIGAALSAEHDTQKLREIILRKSRELMQSDAVSLYLGEPPTPPPSAKPDAEM